MEVRVYDGSFSATRWSQQLRTHLAGRKDVYEKVHTILAKPLADFTGNELNNKAMKRAISITGSVVYQYIDESLHYLLNGSGHDKERHIELASGELSRYGSAMKMRCHYHVVTKEKEKGNEGCRHSAQKPGPLVCGLGLLP